MPVAFNHLRPAAPLPPRGTPRRLNAVPVLGSADPKCPKPHEEGFSDHLEAAIRLNRRRRDIYDRLSGGSSRSFSNTLIALERLTLLPAKLFDAWAKNFQEKGIPVLKDDFVPITEVKSPFAPPRWRGVADDAAAERIQGWLDTYRRALAKGLDANDFAGLAQTTHTLLSRLENVETESKTHWAMTKHMIESLGMGAMNAARYSAQSGGETQRFSRAFIRLQGLGLMGSVALDRKAQNLHARGIGILVNDIPDIPFARRWQAQTEARQ